MLDKPLKKLYDLREAIRELLLQLRRHLLNALEFSTERQYSALNSADYVQEDMSAPYGAESMVMMFDRWNKLEKSFYNQDSDEFDISKIPDIYDSIKFDCIHNSHLSWADYSKVFLIAKEFADCVIPAEYGVSPSQKLQIGRKIASQLIGKLLTDLDNSRKASEEAEGGPPVTPADPVVLPPTEDVLADDEPLDEEEQEEARVHVLAPFTHNVNSVKRHVRTRIYFTSESHIHSLVNILRHSEWEGRSLLSPAALDMLDNTHEFDYLTQIVFRLYEASDATSSTDRFRIEIQFSNGANCDPRITKVMNDNPRVTVHRGEWITLQDFTEHLAPWGYLKKPTGTTSMLSCAMQATTSQGSVM